MPRRAVHCTPDFRLALAADLLAQLFTAAVPVVGSGRGVREAGTVVGTTGLNIRECPDVSCGSRGLAQLEDPIIVTGPEEDGYLPVEWAGKSGWAWHLYVATRPREARRSWKRDAGLQASRAHLQHRYRRAAADSTRSSGSRRRRSRPRSSQWAGGRWPSRTTCGRSPCLASRSAPMATFGSI